MFSFVHKRNGFTLIELIIGIAIIVVIAAFAITSFVGKLKYEKLDKDARNIVALLERARALTLAASNDDWYLVSFGSTTATLCPGSTPCNPSDSQASHTIYGGVTMTPSLAGGGSAVNFNRLTGATSQYGTVTLAVTGTTYTKTINISATGVVELAN